MVAVEICGDNLGASLAEVRYVKVAGKLCTSMVHVSSKLIQCIIIETESHTEEPNTYLSPKDLYLSTNAGNTNGIYEHSLSVVKSGSGKPVISDIQFQRRSFIPYALRLVSTVVAVVKQNDNTLQETKQKTLYWTNIAPNAFNIQRSNIDGSQIETVLNNVSNLYYEYVLVCVMNARFFLLVSGTTSIWYRGYICSY